MIKSKKQSLIVIGVFTLVLMLVTTTYAFFNYTRTGTANVIKTGRISFSTNQTDTINLTNVFPIDKTTIGTDTTNTDEVVISITGDTTYSEGIEYLVTATDVNNTIGSGNNQKKVPISISVTASNLGEEDEEYFDNRENANSHLYRVLAKDVIEENGKLAVGYIKSGATGINGSLTIKAYLDKDKVAITDTYDGNETNNMGTTTEWVDNRTVLTTTEWNALQTNGVSFNVKVESNEGIWVEEIRTINAMKPYENINNIYVYFGQDIHNQKNNIKEVYFNKMGATRMQNAYDAATIKADLTYNNEGKVLAWLEENPDDNTMYNLIVASDGDTYLTTGLQLFLEWSNVEKIEFNNINTSRVTNMNSMFEGCTKLNNINIDAFDTINLQGMYSMFSNCSSLVSLDFSAMNLKNVTGTASLCRNCTSLEYINISNIGNDNFVNAGLMLGGCTKLKKIDMSGFNFGTETFIGGTYLGIQGLTELEEIDLSNIKMTNVTGMPEMFKNCSSLKKIYVSDDWSMSNITLSVNMFEGCTSLVGQAPNTTYAFDSNDSIDKTYAKIATDNEKGYLTDVSLKPTN